MPSKLYAAVTDQSQKLVHAYCHRNVIRESPFDRREKAGAVGSIQQHISATITYRRTSVQQRRWAHYKSRAECTDYSELSFVARQWMLPSPWMYSVIAAARQAKFTDALSVESCQAKITQVTKICTLF